MNGNKNRYLVLALITMLAIGGALVLVAHIRSDAAPTAGGAASQPDVQRNAALENGSLPSQEVPARATQRQTTQNSSYAYSAAPDLQEYLVALPDNGTGNVSFAKARAIDECSGIKNRPNYVEEVMARYKNRPGPERDVVKRYATRTLERCKSLVASGVATAGNLVELYDASEKAGNKGAKARHLGYDVVTSSVGSSAPIVAEDFQPIAIDLLSSSDPDALLEASALMGENSQMKGVAAGSNEADAAWKLVACDFGLDCSNGSALLRMLCLNGGIYCGPGDLRANMMASGFAPDAFARVQQLEQTIYQAVKKGEVSSLFIQ